MFSRVCMILKVLSVQNRTILPDTHTIMITAFEKADMEERLEKLEEILVVDTTKIIT